MPEPLSTATLLVTVGPAFVEGLAKGTGSATGSIGLKAWLTRSAYKRAAKQAVAAAAERHPFPGAEHALQVWRKSPAFENLLLAAALGHTERLTPERVANSFLNVASLGWGRKAEERALQITNTFLNALFAGIADGPGGNAFQVRLAEARHAESKVERAAIQSGVDRIEGNVEGLGRDVRGVDTKLDQLLARDASLPTSVREAVSRGVFDDLTERLSAGDAAGALDLATRRNASVSEALDAINEDGGALADALRPYRQRLLFAAATAASLLGRGEEAKVHAQSALALGSVEAEWHKQAATALFNARLTESLRALIGQVDDDSEAHQEAVPLLAYLDEDWPTVEATLVERPGTDAAFMVAQARIEMLDPSDPDAVADAASGLEELARDVSLPAIRVQVARLTVRLFDRVLRGRTPLSFNRRALTDAARTRTLEALDAVPEQSHLRAQAAAVLSDAARLLRDDLLWDRFSDEREALPAEIHDAIFFPINPTVEDVTARRDRGDFDATQAALLLAATYEVAGNSTLAISTLQEAVYASPDRESRAVVLRPLVRFKRRSGQGDEAAALIRDVPIPDADRWLLQAEGEPGQPNVSEAARFSLDVPVLAFVAERLLTDTPLTPTQEGLPRLPDDPEQRASTWTSRLAVVLPSRSSRFLHAQALWREHAYDELLKASQDLDATNAVQAAEFEAFALEGLGRLPEAADRLVAASRANPDEDRLATNAAAALLHLDRADEVERFLEPWIEQGTSAPGILVNYARSLLVQHPSVPQVASRAFELLVQAYDLHPRRDIAQEAWKAARGAGREREAGRFFVAMTDGAATVEIETPDDAEEALSRSGPGFTRFSGSIEAFAQAHASRAEREREHQEQLDRFSTAHALAYADTFRVAGYDWENWTHWTRLGRNRGPEGFSVLADWPSGTLTSAQRAIEEYVGVFADPTAILTLGALGPERAAAFVEAAAPVHVAKGTLDELRQEGARLENDILVRGHSPAVDLVARLDGSPAVVPYDGAVEAAAPDDPALGASRVDVGVAALTDGRYVTDLDDLEEWDEETRLLAVSSPVLLATLNVEGWVSAEVADAFASEFPDTFAGWRDAVPLDAIPDKLIFNPFAALDWEAVGLLERLEGRVRLGPWAWTFMYREAHARALAADAYDRLRATTAVLTAAVEAGHVVEIEPEPAPPPPADLADEDREAFEAMTVGWSHALRSLQTARAHGLPLWADDRFYPLLLWVGGPTIQGPGTEAIRSAFVEAAETHPPLSTIALADLLARLSHLDPTQARRLAGTLFDIGYRPIHPLTLADAIEQYRPLTSGPLRGRLRSLAETMEALPAYLPDTLGVERRMGYARAAVATLAGQMIAAAWSLPELNTDQRAALADGFLDAAERVFEAQSPTPDAPRADRTRLLFWNAAITALQTLPATDDESSERRHRALRWLGEAAARRTDDRVDITRIFEDHVLDTMGFVTSLGEVELPAQLVGRFALPGLIPLFESGLLDVLDSLLRRTLGRLGRLERHGRIDTTHTIEWEGRPLSFTIPEERDELAALNLIRRVAAGDATLASLIRAAGLAFSYNHTPPVAWVEAGVPEDEGVPQNVEISLFALLWIDATDLHPIVLSALTLHLAVADPALAHQLYGLSDDILSDDEATAEDARDRLALMLLESVHFDLHRDLGHGIWRLRKGSPSRLDRFLGWIGAEDARALAALDDAIAAQVHVIGDIIVPRTHFLARASLTDTFDDGPAVLNAIEASTSILDESEGTKPEPRIEDLDAWLADRIVTAETHTDPFVAGYALRHVLLALRATSEEMVVRRGEEDEPTAEWAERYVRNALGDDREPWHPIAARRRLLRAALQLAAFACSGAQHVAAYEGEDDALTEFLDRTWILTSKLIATLPAEAGGLSEAVEQAERAVADLGLDSTATRAVNRFDPFALSGPDDPGRVLTLAAIYKSLDPNGTTPSWWSEPIQSRIEEIASAPRSERDPDPDDLADGLGIGVALRERILAQVILDRLAPHDDHT